MADNEKGNIKDIRERMTALRGIDAKLADDVINLIFMQYDEVALEGNINFMEYAMQMRRANNSLFDLIYLGHFSRDLTSKRYFYKAGSNLIQLLLTHVLEGNDYEIKKIKADAANRPILVSKGT